MRSLVAILCSIALALVPAAAIGAATNPVRVAAAATLPLETADGSLRFCSLVVVAPDTAMTAAHCNAAPQASTIQNGKRLQITLWDLDPAGRDLALLTIPGLECPCVPVGSKDDLVVGDPTVVFGYPFGGPLVATEGTYLSSRDVLVSNETSPPSYTTYSVLVTAGAIFGGNSGGGLFVVRDSRAYLIGIAVVSNEMTFTGSIDVTK